MDFHRLLKEIIMKTKIILFLLFLTINHYSQVQLGPIAGAVTETSAVILIKTYSPDQEVIIELFTQDDVENSIYSEAFITEEENYNYVKIPVNNLMPTQLITIVLSLMNFLQENGTHFRLFLKIKNIVFLSASVPVSSQAGENLILKYFRLLQMTR